MHFSHIMHPTKDLAPLLEVMIRIVEVVLKMLKEVVVDLDIGCYSWEDPNSRLIRWASRP